MEDILVIKKLHYKNLFNDFNLQISKNTINFIAGSNNCGKTVLFKILTGEIKNYNGYINDLSIISGVFYNEMEFVFDNVYDEITFVTDNSGVDVMIRNDRIKRIIKKYGFKANKKIAELTLFDRIKLAIALEECKNSKVLLLDNILVDLTKEEINEIFKLLTKLKKDMTIIISTNNLDNVLYGDFLHIIDDKKIVLSDEVLKVLKNDSKLNKLGLELPFIADLSLKLKYYDLTSSIETSMNRLVRKLWN